jgi:copper chaperone
MATNSYTVTGMTCGHCVSAVTEEVSALEGVMDVKVAQEGSMVIESTEKLSIETVAAAVAEAGSYGVTEA